MGPYAPLSTFAGVIQIGFAYGLITSDEYHDLKVIKRIRNEAAHCPFVFSFDEPEIKALSMQLKFRATTRPRPPANKTRSRHEEELWRMSESRLHFTGSGVALHHHLMGKIVERMDILIEKKRSIKAQHGSKRR